MRFAAGFVAASGTPSSAGIYTWKYYGTYATAASCNAEGAALVSDGSAEAYRCAGTAGNELSVATDW